MMPLEAAFMICGCASSRAARAASLSPEAIASSTLRMKVRMRVRGTLLIAVLRAILRAAFLAEGVLAISVPYPVPDACRPLAFREDGQATNDNRGRRAAGQSRSY